MIKQKNKFSVIALLMTLTLVALFSVWSHAVLLTLVLAGIGALMLLAEGNPKMISIYLGIIVFTLVAEIVGVTVGVWTYPQPDIFGVPLYIPVLWANLGVFANSFFKHFVKK